MNQEKIGKFICELRKEKNMTQKKLADKLGVTDRAISNWENGRRLPDYSVLRDLCQELGISLNEFFIAKRLSDDTFKEVADNNLFNVLENSVFTLKDKFLYFKNKWEKEHFLELTLVMLIIVFFIIYGFIKQNGLQYLFIIIGFISGIIENNRMMSYIEGHIYGKKSNISIDEFKNSINRLKEFKEKMSEFKTKKDAINYLMEETGFSKQECIDAYDFTMKIDFDKVKEN